MLAEPRGEARPHDNLRPLLDVQYRALDLQEQHDIGADVEKLLHEAQQHKMRYDSLDDENDEYGDGDAEVALDHGPGNNNGGNTNEVLFQVREHFKARVAL